MSIYSISNSVEFSLIGDISFNDLISQNYKNNLVRYKEITPILKNKIVFANLETPINSNHERNKYKSFHLFADYSVTCELLTLLNIGCVSLANNHIFDANIDGVRTTIDLLDKLSIYHSGAGWKIEHTEPVIFTKFGVKIAFFAYVHPSTNPGTKMFPELYINYLHVDKVLEDIKKIRPAVDKIICSLHWGRDYSNFITPEQQILARKIIDAGADVIMGHHSHMIQPFEYYERGLIFYGLGGLTFGDFVWHGEQRALKRKTKLGMIVHLDKQFQINGIIPTRELKGNYIKISRVDIDTRLKVLWFINKLKMRSKFVDKIIRLKEYGLDRIFEYFFGYYRNPVKQLFSFSNLKKLKFIKRDFLK